MAAIFVVELGSDDWTTVLPLQALYLRKNLAIQFLGQTKKHRVLLAEATALRKHPVRNTTIAHLTMTERTQTQDDGHLLLFADFQETAQVSLSIPTEDAFLFLNMTPEDVGGNDSHPTLAHLANLALPLVGRNTRIMDFAHHRTDAMSIDDKTLGVPRHRFPKIGSPHRDHTHEHTGQQKCFSHDLNPNEILLE